MRKLSQILFSLALLAVPAGTWAVPAQSAWRTFVQSDGTTIKVRLCGDENMHYYVTEDGVPLLRAANGDFCYADAYGFAAKSSGIVAHEQARRSPAERRHVSSLQSVEALQARSARATFVAQKRMERRAMLRTTPYEGERRGLVVMMEFPDKSFYTADSRDKWEAILNEEGFADYGANGSVSDYFRDQSGGKFNLKFDVVGPIVAKHERDYYGTDSQGKIDIHVGELVVEACDAAKAAGIDFSDYDWNGDGEVDQVFVLYAGAGQAATGNPESFIWPHEYYISAYEQWPDGYEIDGIKINTYACGCELQGLESTSRGMLSGLGTFCHEFSHCLGLPDFYNTTGGNDMLGEWDLLSDGCYNANGWCPPNYTCHEKELSGWAQSVELDAPASITGLLPMAEGGAAYMVRNDCEGLVDEYYLLENRQQKGWDAYLPDAGLVITHIDYNPDIWAENAVNDDESHFGAAIIPASGTNNINSDRVAWPYNRRDSLTDNSRPAAEVYNLNVRGTYFMGKPITHITHDEDAGTVSFDFMGGASADGIQAVEAVDAASVYGSPATIFDASGRMVARVSAYSGLADGLQAGVYVVKSTNGTTIKVMKK